MLPTVFAVHSTADGKTILFRVYSDTHRDAGGKTMPPWGWSWARAGNRKMLSKTSS